jgi:hypothetical protein
VGFSNKVRGIKGKKKFPAKDKYAPPKAKKSRKKTKK